MVNKINLAIIGAGGIAKEIHLPALLANHLDTVNIVAICDLNIEKANELKGICNKNDVHGVETFCSYFEMFKKLPQIDSVFVLVQPDALFRCAYDSLDKGKSVFMEKPMGISFVQSVSLQEKAKNENLTLTVGYNRRYIPLVKKTFDIIKDLTTITQVEGRFYKNSLSVFYDGAGMAFECDVIHCLDLVRHIAYSSNSTKDFSINSAFCSVKTDTKTGLENAWYCNFNFSNGVTGIVRSNYATGARVHDFEIHGSKASAFINLGFGSTPAKSTIFFSSEVGSFSRASVGCKDDNTIILDAVECADNSTEYFDYYGYSNEQKFFIDQCSNKTGFNKQFVSQDVSTMELVQKLCENKIN